MYVPRDESEAEALSWCDKLGSTPTVGFHLSPNFDMLDAIQSWAPMLDPLVDKFGNPTFTLNESQGGYSFTTKDGFVHSVDHRRVSVSFVHRLKATPVSGGPPIMEMLSKPRPYTELLPEVSDRLIQAARLLPNLSNRKILQVGVVSTTRAALDDVPPGIMRFIDYMKRPWGKEISSFSIEITSDVSNADHWIDRCQHQLIKPEDPDELLTLNFDFHRQYKSPQAASAAQMKTTITKCSEDALAYFEKLAVGNIFDEHVISETTT